MNRFTVWTLALALLSVIPSPAMSQEVDDEPARVAQAAEGDYFVWDGAPSSQVSSGTTFGGTGVGSDVCGADFYDCNCYSNTTTQNRGGFYAGGEVLWFKVHNQGDYAVNLGPIGTQSQFIPFDQEYELTPRGWVGYRGADGLGARATYWEFDHAVSSISGAGVNAQAFATNSQGFFLGAGSGAGGAYTAGYGLEVNVLDLDFTHELQVCQTDVLLAGGLRYAHYASDYNAVFTNAAGAFNGAVLYNHGFSGGGPTFAIEASRAFGETGLAMQAGFRESVLFGNADESIFAAPNNGVLVGTADEVLAITQIRIGVEYGMDVGLNIRAFGRLGYEAQIWHGAGTASNGQLDLGFQGFATSFGVEL